MNRALTASELRLARWMLEHGDREALNFVDQLDLAEVTPWRCACGCASINFQIRGHAEPSPGVHVLGNFVFGSENDLSGAFIFESGGLLRGIEVYGLAGDAPKDLPAIEALRSFEQAGRARC